MSGARMMHAVLSSKYLIFNNLLWGFVWDYADKIKLFLLMDWNKNAIVRTPAQKLLTLNRDISTGSAAWSWTETYLNALKAGRCVAFVVSFLQISPQCLVLLLVLWTIGSFSGFLISAAPFVLYFFCFDKCWLYSVRILLSTIGQIVMLLNLCSFVFIKAILVKVGKIISFLFHYI